MIDLGSMLRDRGDYVASESVLRAAIDIRRRILGEDHPDIVSSMIGFAYTVQAQRKYAEAESILVETHAAWRPRPGVRDAAVLRRLRENIVDVSLQLHKTFQAVVFRQRLASGLASTPD